MKCERCGNESLDAFYGDMCACCVREAHDRALRAAARKQKQRNKQMLWGSVIGLLLSLVAVVWTIVKDTSKCILQ